MAREQYNNESHVSAGAIWCGALIGVGFCLFLGAFGGAISFTLPHQSTTLPSNLILWLLSIAAVALLSFAFFIAGLVAAKISHQKLAFDAVVHSLSAWAIMAILLIFMVAVVTMSENLRKTFSKLEAPAIITDVQVFKAKAITTLKPGDAKAESKKPTAEDKKANKVLTLLWWVAFSSLVLGAGLAIFGGLLGRSKLP